MKRHKKAEVVSGIIKQIPTEELAKVGEVTMDFSDSMYSIAKQCFPNATIVIDCFRIVKRLCGGLESIRLKFKQIAMTENKKVAAAFAKEEERKARQRAYYRKDHRKSPTERRGGKRIKKQKYLQDEAGRGGGEGETS